MNKTTFTEDLENNRLIAVRTFAAPVEKVWEAWRNADLLRQWWAPQPYTCKIDAMDFRVGGYWIYNLNGPEGDSYRGRMDYLEIVDHERIVGEEYFCDEKGEKTDDVPPMQLEVTFEAEEESTSVTATYTYVSPEAFQQMVQMGAAEGWDLSCNQLEELLTK